MTKKEYEQVVKIIEDNMTVSHDNPLSPRIVLTQNGFHNVKEQIKKLIKGEDLWAKV